MVEPPDKDTEVRGLRGFYRRKPILAWAGTAVVVGVIAAAAVILATSSSTEPANVAIKCSVSDSDGTVALELRGKVTQKEADAGCDGVAAKLSGQGSYWRVGLPEPPSTYPEVICAFNAPAGKSGTVLIEDDPESLDAEATSLCGEFAHEGWTQQTQGGVMGEWQAEYSAALEAEEAAASAEKQAAEEAQAEEEERFEEERIESEGREEAIDRCEERVTVKEEAELDSIQREYEAQAAAASNKFKGYEIEEEGYEREDEAYERALQRDEKCSASVE